MAKAGRLQRTCIQILLELSTESTLTPKKSSMVLQSTQGLKERLSLTGIKAILGSVILVSLSTDFVY